MNNFYVFYNKECIYSVRTSHISSYLYNPTTKKLSLSLVGKENPATISDVDSEKYQRFVNALNNSETIEPSYMT
jgi:hypothetical protein